MARTETHRPRLVLALHSHQPTGNVEEVFALAADTCYGPFLELLDKHPSVRFSLHYSGPLLEWLESHRPALLSLAASLVSRGQVEILGGGWQEPVLSALPVRDALGQLRTMRYECARLFGALPRGMWLAERVWEPELPAVVRDAGYTFTFVDDTHLRFAGVLDEHVTGYHVTEKWGRPLAVFPISKALRYAIPFKEPGATLDLLSSRPGETWTYGDDGEKFGLWPGTREWVWEKGWLARFFESLASGQEDGRLSTVLPSHVLDTERPAGRIYLPTASYHEMGEWALPTSAASALRDLRARLEKAGLARESEPFVRGGSWAGFLAKYPEANWLHKRMLRVSDKVAGAESRDRRTLGTLASSTAQARRDLYRSQTNCAYWHGLFGGLYLPHLRRALWLHLLRAENAVDPVEEGLRITHADLDCDGMDEILVETPHLTCAVAPAAGGCLAEIVHRPSCLNLVDTLARRPELYHALDEPAGQARKEEEIDTIHTMKKEMTDEMRAMLVYDPLPRRAFQEAILAPGFDTAALERGEVSTIADLASMDWKVVEEESRGGKQHVTLSCRVRLETGSLEVKKRFVFPSEPRVTASYELRWDGAEPLEAVLVTRLNINLLAGDAHDRYYEPLDPATDLPREQRRLGSRGAWERTARVALVDEHEGLRVEIEASPVCDLHRHPVETVSQTESGFQLTYQGSCLALAWPLKLENWVEWKGRASLECTRT